MRTVLVARGTAEKTPVQIRDDAHLAELIQRFGAGSVLDAETDQPVDAPSVQQLKAEERSKKKGAKE